MACTVHFIALIATPRDFSSTFLQIHLVNARGHRPVNRLFRQEIQGQSTSNILGPMVLLTQPFPLGWGFDQRKGRHKQSLIRDEATWISLPKPLSSNQTTICRHLQVYLHCQQRLQKCDFGSCAQVKIGLAKEFLQIGLNKNGTVNGCNAHCS